MTPVKISSCFASGTWDHIALPLPSASNLTKQPPSTLKQHCSCQLKNNDAFSTSTSQHQRQLRPYHQPPPSRARNPQPVQDSERLEWSHGHFERSGDGLRGNTRRGIYNDETIRWFVKDYKNGALPEMIIKSYGELRVRLRELNESMERAAEKRGLLKRW